MTIGQSVNFKDNILGFFLPIAQAVGEEIGIVSAIETRDGGEYLNIIFPSYGEIIGVHPDLFVIHNNITP